MEEQNGRFHRYFLHMVLFAESEEMVGRTVGYFDVCRRKMLKVRMIKSKILFKEFGSHSVISVSVDKNQKLVMSSGILEG